MVNFLTAVWKHDHLHHDVLYFISVPGCFIFSFLPIFCTADSSSHLMNKKCFNKSGIEAICILTAWRGSRKEGIRWLKKHRCDGVCHISPEYLHHLSNPPQTISVSVFSPLSTQLLLGYLFAINVGAVMSLLFVFFPLSCWLLSATAPSFPSSPPP